MTHSGSYLLKGLLALCLFFCAGYAAAQQPNPPGGPTTLPNAPQRDTSKKGNTPDWHDEAVSVSWTKLQSEKLYEPDTSLHTFHRKPFTQPWYRNMGNHGGPVLNLMFTPEYRVGPTLGYHVFDVYRYDADSVNYYNTTKAYSEFIFQLASKQEQTAQLLHTQNIKPNWNFALVYRKITSPGYYNLQRTNHDNAAFSTNYQSRDQHYELYSALVYNKEQNDENGGIIADSLVASPDYTDKRTIPVRFRNDRFTTNSRIPRSSVSNTLRDFSLLLQHRYAFGKTDTIYNEDSTRYSYKFTPRFGITHRFQVSSTKYQYKDVAADSLHYTDFFNAPLKGNFHTDSVDMSQRWISTDNRLLLNGFLGRYDRQLRFSAGTGIRFDRFTDEYPRGNTTNRITSNYLIAEASKEATDTGAWFYSGNAMIYFTGEAAGNSLIQAELGKNISYKAGDILFGFKQAIDNAPYNYTIYQNDYDTILNSFSKESVTQLYGTIQNTWLKLSGGVRSYVIGNYIYLNGQQLSAQYAPTFNLTQAWLQKVFTWHKLVFDNELVYQQAPGSAPVNVPLFLGRHQLSLETSIFHRLLKIATGAEVRYHSPYKPAGYSPFFNRFYYQNSYLLVNDPEVSVFFNFRIKRFRTYIMADQFQYIFTNVNNIAAPGYPLPNFMIRFGFSWVLVN